MQPIARFVEPHAHRLLHCSVWNSHRSSPKLLNTLVKRMAQVHTASCSAWTLTAPSKSAIPSHYHTMSTMMMTSLLRASVSPRSSIGRSSEDIERTFCVHILARYQASMLRSLKEVQGDDSIVGFYQAMALGSFTNQTLVETQAIQQEKLRS